MTGATTATGAGGGGVRRGAALMASGTAVSRVLGLLRGMVLVAAIGATGQAADAFAVANKLPNVLYMVLAGGLLNAVLVPQVVRAYRRGAGQEYVDRLLTLGFVVLAGLTVLLTLAAPLLVTLYADDAAGPRRALAVAFATWCVPQLFFYGVYALLGQVLNARGSFGPYMWAPVVNNVVAIAGFGVFIAVFGGAGGDGAGAGGGLQDASTWSSSTVAVLAAAATLGVVAQAAVLVPSLRRAGVRYRPRLDLRGSGLGRAGTVVGWTFAGLVVGQLAYVVVSRVAWDAPAAAGTVQGVAGNAAYDYGFLVFMLPHSLVTVSLATALFTRLAAQAHDEDLPAVRGTLSLGLRVVGLFTVLAAAVVLVLAVPVTRLVLVTGAAADVPAVAGVVTAMVVGLPAFGAWSMAQRVYYAYEDARGLLPVQVAMAVVVAGGALLGRAVLPPSSWVAGAGVAMSVSYVLGALVALVRLRGRLRRLDGRRVLRTHVQAVVAALVAAGLGLAVLRGLEALLADTVGARLLECVVVGTVMGLVYLGGLRLMHVAELEVLLGPAARVLRRLLARGRRR
ncbi:murein biosynthesis integral membrane protein MurJ [Cellulomonas marina]|uniref:Putative peptidoglycan lipid II flippase n=1 Tax=Cellulomonas marina TaxID=988821 RepID=A0A1I0YHM2_9CELL|nr:murein biosynthesis integral membrane protein MurJ [Cellulomonas marina]GIG28673.1 hypothetical protein Cma02nite_12730 [Cellulomonas marina]SFB12711.1 putative peptidoglycan lipid II flippase [Cellulomonas marina]